MFSDETKNKINTVYRQLLDKSDFFIPRKEQKYLISAIAKMLTTEEKERRKVLVVEAGTGIGKSLAYLLGSIPVALEKKMKVCIATATVALQEQLVYKDLPWLKFTGGLDFSYTLVKGRNRYACIEKLKDIVIESNERQQSLLLNTRLVAKEREQFKRLLKDYQAKKWNGDRDNIPIDISEKLWNMIVSDRYACNRKFVEHIDCPFHRARNEVNKMDVLIVNHNILVSDLILGGGKLLPEPDEMFYVIDEAHHLPKITRKAKESSILLAHSIDNMKKLSKLLIKIDRELEEKTPTRLKHLLSVQQENTQCMLDYITSRGSDFFSEKKLQYRFVQGTLPKELSDLVKVLFNTSEELLKKLAHLDEKIVSLCNNDSLSKLNNFRIELQLEIDKLKHYGEVWKRLEWSKENNSLQAVWVDKQDQKKVDYLLHVSPIEMADVLTELLWEKTKGVVLLSATLRTSGDFNYFRYQTGLKENDGSQYICFSSPFDYQKNSILFIPKMKYEPKSDLFMSELIEKMPDLLEDQISSLVLFTSYKQMNEVANQLREFRVLNLLVQGEYNKEEIVIRHKKLVDNGENSIIFGTDSYAEGIDLPGQYLVNLIITKLPFAVPTSPIEAAHAEYFTSQGKNPFIELAIPETAKKLLQACGRLIRGENDYGRITILDRRIVSKPYGQALLDTLPNYKLYVE